MVGTKLVARKNYNQRMEQFRRSNQRRPNTKRPRKGIKNIEGRIRNRDIKIKQLIPQPKNVKVKKNRNVIQPMVLRCRTMYPAQRKTKKRCILIFYSKHLMYSFTNEINLFS